MSWRTASPRRRSPLPRAALCFALCLAAALPAAAWQIDQSAPASDLEAFHRHFSTAVYHYPRHDAAPLGLVGFAVYADATYNPDFDGEPYAETVLDGDLTGGALSVARVGVRKGLPGGIDLGAAYGKVLEGGLELVSADLQWAILEGGAVTPALSLRATYTQTLDSDDYELTVYGAEVLVSKGFAVLTPYAGAGLVRGESRFDAAPGGPFEVSDTRGVLYAGLTLNLLLPKITVEVEQGEDLQAALRVSFGF